jgi:hypothetical protein
MLCYVRNDGYAHSLHIDREFEIDEENISFLVFRAEHFTVKFFFLNFKISEIWKHCSKTLLLKILHGVVSILNNNS